MKRLAHLWHVPEGLRQRTGQAVIRTSLQPASQQDGSHLNCAQQTLSACLLPGETAVYLAYICMRWRPKSLMIGWENVAKAAVSCSSHLLKQELREVHSYGFLIVCLGLQSFMPKCVMFWFWYAFYIMSLSFFSFFLLPVFLEPFPFSLLLCFPFHLLLSLLFWLFQGIPGEPGKRGKMGRPVKFCLNILYR